MHFLHAAKQAEPGRPNWKTRSPSPVEVRFLSKFVSQGAPERQTGGSRFHRERFPERVQPVSMTGDDPAPE